MFWITAYFAIAVLMFGFFAWRRRKRFGSRRLTIGQLFALAIVWPFVLAVAFVQALWDASDTIDAGEG